MKLTSGRYQRWGRMLLPYGEYLCPDGSRYLFNRNYSLIRYKNPEGKTQEIWPPYGGTESQSIMDYTLLIAYLNPDKKTYKRKISWFYGNSKLPHLTESGGLIKPLEVLKEWDGEDFELPLSVKDREWERLGIDMVLEGMSGWDTSLHYNYYYGVRFYEYEKYRWIKNFFPKEPQIDIQTRMGRSFPLLGKCPV